MQKKLAILKTAVYEELVNQVRDNLTPDLLKPQFRDAPFPMGHCYVASEAIYHLAGGKKSGLKPMRLRMPDGVVHWWLEAPDGEVIDPTHDQFDHAVPYAEGKSGGFLTREPSARARELMSRIEGRQAKSANIIDIHGLKPHAHDELTRRTFIYIIPTDHLYLSENNAYHNDMFDWIYQNAPEDSQYLESHNFALGFIERNYEDRALEVKNYWAEGDRVPDNALRELEQYFGERIYQTDFDYPRDWRTIEDTYDDWYGDSTQQWPTNALEGNEPYDPLSGYEQQRQANIWKLAFDNNFVYTGDGQLFIENRPHPQIIRDHHLHEPLIAGILMEKGDTLYMTFFSWSQNFDDPELQDRARQAIEYATGKFPTEVSYEEMNNLDVQHQGAMYDDNTRMNQRWDEHYDSLPFVWFKGQVWLGKMPSDHASLLRQNPDLHAAIKEVHDAPWTDSNDPEYWFGRVFRDGEVVDWQDRPVPDRVANDVKAQMTDEHWNYDEDEGRYSATIKQIKFQPTEWGGSREGYAQPVVYDQTNDVVYIGPNGASHSETLRNVQEHRDLVEHPVDEYGNEIEQMPPGYGYSDDPRYDQLGFGEIFVSPFTHRMDWDWYSGPEPQETIQQYVDKFNQDAPPVVPPLSFESGTQPIEVMYSNPHEYEDYQYWLNGGYHNDPDRARLAWVWHDGTLFIGQNHKSIMRGMQQEGLDARTNSAFGWIDPTEDGTPWSFVTDYGTQDAQAQQEASLFFNTYGPNRVMDYARNGTPLHKASGGTWEYPPGDYVYSFIYQNGHLYIEGGGHYQIMRNHLNEIDPNAPLAAGWIFKDGQHFYIAFYSGALLGHGNAEQEREAWKLLQKQYPDATIWSNQFNDEAMNDPNERQDLGWIDERFALPPLPTPHDISPVAGYGMDGLYYFTPKAWIYDPQTKEILNGDYHRNIMRKNPDLFNDREWNDVVYGWYDNDNQRAMAAPESYGHPREDEAVEAAQKEMLSNPIFYEDVTSKTASNLVEVPSGGFDDMGVSCLFFNDTLYISLGHHPDIAKWVARNELHETDDPFANTGYGGQKTFREAVRDGEALFGWVQYDPKVTQDMIDHYEDWADVFPVDLGNGWHVRWSSGNFYTADPDRSLMRSATNAVREHFDAIKSLLVSAGRRVSGWKITGTAISDADQPKVMRQINELARSFGINRITWIDDPERAQVHPVDGTALLAVPNTEEAYIGALHELGHAAFLHEMAGGHYEEMDNTQEEEWWSWHWALEHAIIPLSTSALGWMRSMMDTYRNVLTPPGNRGWLQQEQLQFTPDEELIRGYPHVNEMPADYRIYPRYLGKTADINDHTEEWELPAAQLGDWIGYKYLYDPTEDTLHAWQINEPDGHPWHREALKKLFPFESSQFLYETYVCGWSENNTYSVYKFQQSDEAIARAEQLIKEYIESLGYKDVKPYLGKVAYDGYYPDWGSAWIYDPSTKKLYVGSYHGEIIAENPELTYKMRGGYDHMHPQDVVPFSVPYVLGWIRDGEPEVDSDFGEMENISPNDVNDAIHAVFQYLENRHSSSVRPVRTSTADMRNKNVIVEPFNPWDGYIFAYDPANSTIYTGPTNMWHRKLLDAIGKFRWDATWIYGWNHMNSDGLQVHNIREEQLETIEQLLKDNPWIYYNSKLAALKLQPITENLGNDMGRARYGYPVIFIGNTAFIGPLGSHHADIVRYLAAHNYSIDFYSADDMANIWPPHTLGDNEDWVAEPYGTHLDPEDKVQLEDWARQQAGNKTAELTQEVEPRYNLPWDNNSWQGGWIYDPKDDKLYTGRFHAGIMRENPQLFYRDDVVFGHFANNGDPIHGSFEQNSNPFQEDIDRGISLAKQWWFEHAPKYKQTAYGGEGFIFIYDTETGQLAVGPDWDLHKDLFRQEFGSHIQMNEYPERYVFGYNGHHGLFFYNWPDEDKKHEVEQALDQYFHTSKTATTFVAADPGSIEYANRWIYMVKDRTITSAEVPSMTIPYDWNWFTSWIYVPALDKLMISPKPSVNHGQLMRANPELASEIWNEKLPVIPGLIVQQNYYDPYDQPVKPKLGILPVYSDEFEGRQMMGEDSDIERAVKAVQAWADANTDWGEPEIVHDDEEQNYSTEGKIAMPWSGEGNVPRYLYHVSPTAARASIQTHGLDWSQRAEDLWSEKGFDFGSEEYPAGNYLFVDEKRAWEYPDAHIGKQFDLWRVDTEGLYLEGDPQFPTDEDDIPEDIDPEDTPDYMAYYTTDPIPFNRLTLMDTVTGQGWDQYASVRTLTHQNLRKVQPKPAPIHKRIRRRRGKTAHVGPVTYIATPQGIGFTDPGASHWTLQKWMINNGLLDNDDRYTSDKIFGWVTDEGRVDHYTYNDPDLSLFPRVEHAVQTLSPSALPRFVPWSDMTGKTAGTTMYHVTWSDYVPSILQSGLEPGDPGAQSYEGAPGSDWVGHNPTAVYLWPDLANAESYLESKREISYGLDDYPVEPVILAVNVDGLDVRPAPDGEAYTMETITPDRLRLLSREGTSITDSRVHTSNTPNLSLPIMHLSGQVMRRWIVVNGELYINEGQDSSHADMYKRLFRASDAQEQLQAGGMIEPSGVISIYYNTTGIRAPQLRRWVADSLNRTPLTPIGQHPHQTCPPRVPPWMEQEHLLPTESTFRVEDTVTVQAHSPDALHGEAHSPNRLAVSNALNVVNLTGWDNVVGRARAVAFASDGTNLYFGISHPQIVDEVMKQENIPGVPTQMHPMFNDANWVFGWADRIGPDDPWDAQIQSGNFWHQNKVNQGFDERIRRAVLQYLNTGQIESHISSSDDYTIVGEGRDYGHNAVIYDELNQHMYIAPGGHHYDILREFPYLVGARTLWFEVDPAGKLQQYDFGERASIDPEIQEIYDEWRNTQRTSAVNYDPNNDSWFQSWFYFPENGGLFVNPERYGNHRELIQQLGLSKEDILNRKLVPGQFWFRISNGKKAVELDIYSDYLRNEDLEWVRPDYFANLTQLAVKSATEWIKENYPEFKLISLATMDTLHSPESHLSATPKVVHIPGDEDDDFADMEWRIPLVYDWSDNTVYFGDYDALHRTLLKAIAGEEDGSAMRVDKNRFSTGYFVGEGVEGFTPGVHWFAFYDMKTPPPDVTQAVNNTLKESHISAVPPPAIIQPSPVVKNPAGVNFPTMKPTPVRGEEPVPNPAGYSYDYPEQQIGVTAANLSLTAAQVASGHVAVWLGAFHSSKSWIQGGIGHTAGQDQPYVYVEIGHQNGQQQYMPIAPYTPGTPIHFQLVNRNGIWSVKVGNKLYGQVYLGNNLETRAIAEDLYDQQPNEFQWHIQPTQQKHAEQLELNFDPDIGPKVVHIPTRGGFSKWRIPVMYDANSNTVYYGDEGGLHADLLRWILGHSDFAHGDVAVENDPDRWAAGWTTLGGPRDPGENKWFGGGIEPGPEVMEAVKNALGIQESHKEASSWNVVELEYPADADPYEDRREDEENYRPFLLDYDTNTIYIGPYGTYHGEIFRELRRRGTPLSYNDVSESLGVLHRDGTVNWFYGEDPSAESLIQRLASVPKIVWMAPESDEFTYAYSKEDNTLYLGDVMKPHADLIRRIKANGGTVGMSTEFGWRGSSGNLVAYNGFDADSGPQFVSPEVRQALQESHIATTIEQLPEVDPDDVYEPTKRKPFVYSPQEDKVYIGPYGAHHFQVIFKAFDMDNPDREQIGLSLEDDPGNLGIILDDNAQIFYWGEPHQAVVNAMKNLYPSYTQEVYDWVDDPLYKPSRKEAITWEDFANRENLTADDFPDYISMVYDATRDKLFTNRELNCSPYHPIILRNSPELQQTAQSDPSALYFGGAGFKDGKWLLGWDSLEEEQGDTKHHRRATQLAQQLLDSMGSNGTDLVSTFVGEPVRNMLVQSEAEEDPDDFPGYGNWYGSFFYDPKTDKVYFSRGGHGQVIEDNGHGLPWDRMIAGWLLVPEGVDTWTDPSYDGPFIVNTWGGDEPGENYDSFPEGTKERIKDALRRDGWKIAKAKVATEIKFVPNSMNDAKLNTDRVPFVWDSKTDTLYYAEAGGLHPWIYKHLLGNPLHATQIHRQKDLDQQFASGVINPKRDDDFLSGVQWFYGPDPTPEAQRAAEELKEKLYGFNYT